LVWAAILALLLGTRPLVAQSPQPYTLDVIINLTGSNAFAGNTYADALHVFERYINAHGGINGRPVHFELHDDQSSVAIAVQIANQLLAAHPLMVFGGSQVADCAAVAPLMQTNGPVDFCISPGYLPQPGSYAFASSTSASYIFKAILHYAHLKGYHRIATINPTDAGGQATDKILGDLAQAPENRDLTIVTVEHFAPGDLSVAAQIERIRAAKPDVLITYASGPGFGTILRNLYDSGAAIPVMTSAANLDPVQLNQYKAFLPKSMVFNALLYYGRDTLPRGLQRQTIDDFINAFKGGNERLTPGSGFAWDPAWIIVSAIRKLGPSATPAQLRDYLAGLHGFVGVNGTYDFRIGDQHGLTDNAVIFVRWDPVAGDFVPVAKPGGIPF
jgi:branched-chain amino acid transport system substrate-binding protein